MLAARPDLFQAIAGETHVALAVSGGSDSMALLRLVHEFLVPLRVTGRVVPGFSVLTVDHGLRKESAAEAAQVSAWCAALGLPHLTLRWPGDKPATGIQAKARKARYDLMSDWCQAHGATVLMTAHTLDDQAETVLMRLARTSSIDSLAGIHRWSQWNGVRLFRPLLDLKRRDMRVFLQGMSQAWIDDPSNEDERYERVRIRRALPVLEGLGITPEGLAGLADRALEASQALWGATDDWVRLHVIEHESGFCTVPVQAFADQTPLLQARILGWLTSRYGGGKMPEPAELELLAAWFALGRNGRRTLGGAIIARRTREMLIGREPGRIDPAPVIVPASGKLMWDKRFEISAAPGSPIVPAFLAAKLAPPTNLPAFVRDSLPAILPWASPQTGIVARFCSRLKS